MTSPQLDVGAEHGLPGHLIRFVRPPAAASGQDHEHLRRRHHSPEELPLQCISEVDEQRGSLAESRKGEEEQEDGKSTRLPDTPADAGNAPLQSRTPSKTGSEESSTATKSRLLLGAQALAQAHSPLAPSKSIQKMPREFSGRSTDGSCPSCVSYTYSNVGAIVSLMRVLRAELTFM